MTCPCNLERCDKPIVISCLSSITLSNLADTSRNMAASTLVETPVIYYIDPSEHCRPEEEFRKGRDNFRDYSLDESDPIKERVRKTYLKMHTHQTVDFVKKTKTYWTRFGKAKMTIMQALEMLNKLVDESDPDVDVPNIVHAFQTAERIRQDYPEQDWFQLTGLIHDCGKVMAFLGNIEQWAIVGDTFPVGCAFAPSIVYRETSFNKNPDLHNPKYNTKVGMYSEHCGLDNVLMSWGHDEYMYQVLENHGHTLPDEAMAMIRYHSFYPWHLGGDYNHLCNDKDIRMKNWIKIFNRYDLYSKADHTPDIEELQPYYQSLIDKYIPGVISW